MQYHGKLYGKIGNKYFDTGKTTDDYDELHNFSKQVCDLIPLLEYPGDTSYEHENEAIAVKSMLDKAIELSNKK